jgi:hypothetical protein
MNTKRKKKGNPVAKFMIKYNKAVTMRDRKHDYKRKPKHKEMEDG